MYSVFVRYQPPLDQPPPRESTPSGGFEEAAPTLIPASFTPPPPRTKWTRRVPHPVLIGHALSPRPQATFVSPQAIDVGEGLRIEAEHFLIATVQPPY